MEENKNECQNTVETEAAPEVETDAKKAKKADKAAKDEAKKLRAENAELAKRAEAAEAKAATAEDKYMRLAAEYDNFRKRSAKEHDGIYADATADAVTGLLPILDNLQRATAYTESDKVAEGVKMILGNLPAVLEKMNITPFGEAGERFDPNIHNAVFHVEDEAYGENEIVEVLQCGYKHGDRIIRYAMVKVAN